MSFIKNNREKAFFLCLVFFLYGYFAIGGLGRAAVIDEPLWTYGRVPKFWNKIADRDLEKTLISDKPGITVALVSGIALTQVDPKEYRTKKESGFIVRPEKNLEHFNFIFRLPIVVFTLAIAFFFYFFTAKLFNPTAAVLAAVLIFLSPLLIGMSRIINPDSLLWIFIPLSVFCYLISLKSSSRKYALISGLFFGLALLTKYVANILFVYFLIVPLLAGICGIAKDLKAGLTNYFIACATALAVFFLLLPAAWLNPFLVLDATFFSQAFSKFWPYFLLATASLAIEAFIFKSKCSKNIFSFFSSHSKALFTAIGGFFIFFLFFALANVYTGMNWIDFEAAAASPKTFHGISNFFQLFAANFYSLAFGVSPIILIAAFVCFFYLLKKDRGKENIFVFSALILFILLYYFASAANLVSATVRYQIVIFPLFFALVAGFSELTCRKYFSAGKSRKLILAVIISFLVFELFSIRPFYFSYASPLLPEKYVLNVKDMGDGSFEAAQRLNAISNAKNLTIWSDKSGVCFFFTGKCYSDMDFNNPLMFDYFVVSAGRESKITRLIKGRMANGMEYAIDPTSLYAEKDPFWKLEIGGRPNNYVKIISVDKFKK